jgi:uncharacterized protein (TIRG00374 family)
LKAAAIRTARLAVAGGLTAYILWKSNPREVLAVAAAADWRPFAVAVVLVIVDRGLMAYRWIALLYTLDPVQRPPLASILRVFFVSTFLGSFLPSVGGDAVRAYSIARLHIRGGDAVASVFMDRMLGVASILVMAAAGLLLAHDLAGNVTIVLSLAVAASACAVTLALVFSDRAARSVSAVLLRMPASVRHGGDRVLDSIRRYATHRGRLANVLAGSIAVQILRIVQAYFLGLGLAIAVPLPTYFAFIPLILLVMLLPVTINGIGTSQAAFVWFFGRAGVPAAPAFTLSVLFIALGVVGNLPGGLLYVFGTRGVRLRNTDHV